MNDYGPSNLSALWSRAGAMFMIRPAEVSPDLERLLIETSRHMPEEPRWFVMAATWLSLYGHTVSTSRLLLLLKDESDPLLNSTLGFLLDSARSVSHSTHFDGVIAMCQPAEVPQPLFRISSRSAALRELTEKHASELSRKWNLWADPFEPKYNAIRPEWWIRANNPNLQWEMQPI